MAVALGALRCGTFVIYGDGFNNPPHDFRPLGPFRLSRPATPLLGTGFARVVWTAPAVGVEFQYGRAPDLCWALHLPA